MHDLLVGGLVYLMVAFAFAYAGMFCLTDGELFQRIRVALLLFFGMVAYLLAMLWLNVWVVVFFGGLR